MGAVGEQGVVQFEFLGSSTTTLELFTKVDAPQLDALLNGMLSRNLTPRTFPSGAVRGQILSTDIALISCSLRVNTTGAND